ncbi:MAG: hypothetical protein C0402_06335 [Thermodesulfovibrio sp.]|nr:hypothetical protein [Thermodesulfovibrio sp.]
MPLAAIEEVNIETVNTCTRKCSYCKFGLERAWERKVMEEDVFEKILLDLKAIQYSGLISPFVNNEPLMDKRIVSFIRRISIVLPEAESYLFTNGDLLEMGILGNLFDAGLRKLFISAHSEERMGEFLEMARYFGDSRVSLTTFYDFDKQRSFHNRGGSVTSDIVNQTTKTSEGCCLPSRQMVINPDGDVYLCCCDFYYDVVFGNVRNASAVDIFLRNTRLEEIRNSLEGKGRSGLTLCENCSVPGYGPLLKLDT